MSPATITISDAGTVVDAGRLSVVYLYSWPYGSGQLCPRCGCCTWETRGFPDGEGVCVGRCADPEAMDHPVVLGRYCPACLGEHHGWTCPELTRGLA